MCVKRGTHRGNIAGFQGRGQQQRGACVAARKAAGQHVRLAAHATPAVAGCSHRIAAGRAAGPQPRAEGAQAAEEGEAV